MRAFSLLVGLTLFPVLLPAQTTLPARTAAVLGASAASVELVPISLRGAIQPQVAVTPEGLVGVCFGRSGIVYAAVSVDGGRQFAAPVEVGRLPKLALGLRRGPRIAVARQALAVSAISHADGNVHTWSSADVGRTWVGTGMANSVTNAAREGLHAMAADPKGNIHLAWLDLRNQKTELWGTSSADGGRTWARNRLIYRSPAGHICECCHPTLAVDGKGQLWAMWRNWLDGARDMYASMSADGGVTFSTARKLGTGTWTLQACPMDGGLLAFDGEDRLRSVWRRHKAIVTADFEKESILAQTGLQPVVGAGNGVLYYLWQAGPRLLVQKGAGAAEILDPSGGFPVIASASPSAPPVVVWESSTNGVKTLLARVLNQP